MGNGRKKDKANKLNTGLKKVKLPIQVGAIAFHGGGQRKIGENGKLVSLGAPIPHEDELAQINVLLLLGVIVFPKKGPVIIRDISKYVNNPRLARRHYLKGAPDLKGWRVIFAGWTPGGGDWNHFDEHENITREIKGASALTQTLINLGIKIEDQRDYLYNALTKMGFTEDLLPAVFERFERYIATVARKDGSSSANQLEPSGLHKTRVYGRLFPMSSLGVMGEASYKEAFILSDLMRNRQTVLNVLIGCELNGEVDAHIEQMIVVDLAERLPSPWRPSTGEIQQVFTVLDLWCHFAHVNKREKSRIGSPKEDGITDTEAWQRQSELNNLKAQYRRTRDEHKGILVHMANQKNTADYNSDAWVVNAWLLWNQNETCPIPLTDKTEVEELARELGEERHKDVSVRLKDYLNNMLKSNTPEARALAKNRKVREEQSDYMDGDHLTSLQGFHNQARMFWRREQLRRSGDNDTFVDCLRVTDGATKQFVKDCLDTVEMRHRLWRHAKQQVREYNQRLPMLVKGLKGHVDLIDTLNPIASSVLRKENPVSVITFERDQYSYVAVDHDRLGYRLTNVLYECIAVLVRACEYKVRGIRLPKNWRRLRDADKMKDRAWYLQVLPPTKQDPFPHAVNLMCRSIFRRGGPGTRLKGSHVAHLAQIVCTGAQLIGKRVVVNGEEFEFNEIHLYELVARRYKTIRNADSFKKAHKTLLELSDDAPSRIKLVA